MAYPVHVRIEYRERQSRSRTLLRASMVLPHLVVLVVLQLAAIVVLVVAWFAILLTGRYPRALFGFVAGTLRYSTRVGCYWLLLTDRFPPFGLGARADGYPVAGVGRRARAALAAHDAPPAGARGPGAGSSSTSSHSSR